MPVFALLLALQAAQDPPEDEPMARRTHAHFGPIVQYWLPRFGGDLRIDGSTPGTKMNFVHDLDLPNDAAIPIYGGGKIGGRIYSGGEWATLSGVAEWWSRAWKGEEALDAPITLGDATFPTGITVNSRLTLTSVTLDIEFAGSSKNVNFGADLSIQILSARMRMDSALVDATERIDTVCWGGGIFLDLKPVSFLFAGLSLKGFTNFGNAGETGAGDFRFYAGAEWGPFRLEGGLRIFLYDHDLAEESLNFTLWGAYVQASVIVRF
jgi:hypothetical protein